MKFICALPESKHYLPLESKTEGRYYWRDKSSSLIRIITSHPVPWEREWVIMPSIQKVKNYDFEYPGKLDIKCFEITQSSAITQKGKMHRERMRGKFAYAQNSPRLVFCFPIEPNERTYMQTLAQQWLLYSFW